MMNYIKFKKRLYQELDNELSKDPGIMSYSEKYLAIAITDLVLTSFDTGDQEKLRSRLVHDTQVWVLTRKSVCNHQLGRKYERTEKSRGSR